MNEYEKFLKTKTVTKLDEVNAIKWLYSKIKSKDKFEFGKIYRLDYQNPNTLSQRKIIIPISVEEDIFLCLDLLSLMPIIRAIIFDMISENEMQLDIKTINKIKNNVFVKNALKKYKISKDNLFTKVKLTELETVLYLPLLLRKDQYERIASDID
jgi:hypothetical protein